MSQSAQRKTKKMRETVTVSEVIEFLNELLELDQKAIELLVDSRVPCSDSMASHPTVQVTGYASGAFKVGMLGILNGIFGVDAGGWGPISAVYDDDSRLIHFERTER